MGQADKKFYNASRSEVNVINAAQKCLVKSQQILIRNFADANLWQSV
jgi:hypothetical protein